MRCVLTGTFMAALMMSPLPAFAQTGQFNHLDCRYDEGIKDIVCPEIPTGRASAEPVVTPAPAAPVMPVKAQRGTAEWNAACAAKYKSFDPQTGMYRSYSGQMRPCK